MCQNVYDYLFYVRIILTSKIHQCGTTFGHNFEARQNVDAHLKINNRIRNEIEIYNEK